jgi:hypothetical protein
MIVIFWRVILEQLLQVTIIVRWAFAHCQNIDRFFGLSDGVNDPPAIQSVSTHLDLKVQRFQPFAFRGTGIVGKSRDSFPDAMPNVSR